ncbi:hypothetical protein EVAR_35398_1 [Eumeta japonica]|uniref:Reverse transcriptase zinc-binding domain-containing protein n=1 Tax=Eumeta variegata TaxID=151549 RepID=A0A4C1XCP1_EUMVA|nr:hypothetical protein EVAR_35398_1 [Eumeta japonica]
MELLPDTLKTWLLPSISSSFQFKHYDSPECSSCLGVTEDTEHVLFVCPRFNPLRNDLKARPQIDNLTRDISRCIVIIEDALERNQYLRNESSSIYFCRRKKKE